jgi:hypothetical protein
VSSGSRQGTLTLLNSTVSANTASQFGGGLQISSGSATVDKSTVSGNLARANGGGLNNSGTLTLTNSTVSGNSVSQDGGGVYHADDTLFLNETLISGNTAVAGPELYNVPSASSTINANNSNLFGHGGDAGVTNFTPGANDLVPGVALAAVLSTALADNGGPTGTHALVAGSPAIDAAGTCLPTTDQRGIPRPQGADGDGDGFPDCDIGAFEIGVALPLPPPPPPPPPLPEAAPATPQIPIPCRGSRCRLPVTCNLSPDLGTPCSNRIDLIAFVPRSALRLSDDGSTRAPRRIRFASGISNIPPGGTADVRLRLTKRGKQVARMVKRRLIRGLLEIRNASGTVIGNTPVRIRIRRR